MTSTTFFIVFIPVLAIILLSVNLILAPHNPDQEKNSTFECGFHSFLGQNRMQFYVPFFIVGVLFMLFDTEVILLLPFSVSMYHNESFGLGLYILFLGALGWGLVFELSKDALSIESKQDSSNINKDTPEPHAFASLPLLSTVYSDWRKDKHRLSVNEVMYHIDQDVDSKRDDILSLAPKDSQRLAMLRTEFDGLVWERDQLRQQRGLPPANAEPLPVPYYFEENRLITIYAQKEENIRLLSPNHPEIPRLRAHQSQIIREINVSRANRGEGRIRFDTVSNRFISNTIPVLIMPDAALIMTFFRSILTYLTPWLGLIMCLVWYLVGYFELWMPIYTTLINFLLEILGEELRTILVLVLVFIWLVLRSVVSFFLLLHKAKNSVGRYDRVFEYVSLHKVFFIIFIMILLSTGLVYAWGDFALDPCDW